MNLFSTLKRLLTGKSSTSIGAPRTFEFYDTDGNRVPTIEEITQARDEAIADLNAIAKELADKLREAPLEPQINGGPHDDAIPLTVAPKATHTITTPSLTVHEADGTVRTIKPVRKARTPKVPK